MTMVQWKSGCDYYLLSYEHFYLPNLHSKIGLKKCFLPQHLECRFGPTATGDVTESFLGMKILIKHFKESCLAPEICCIRNVAAHFLKPKESLIFGFLAKGGPHETFLESFNFTNG